MRVGSPNTPIPSHMVQPHRATNANAAIASSSTSPPPIDVRSQSPNTSAQEVNAVQGVTAVFNGKLKNQIFRQAMF